MCVSEESYQKELWRKKFPAIIGALLSVFQMLFTGAIVGCEIVGDFVQFPRMNIFVGYWTFPLFMCAWISLAGASCCCRIRCCGTTTLVFQCLSIPMALCVIGFDAYFLKNPTQCFFSNDCSSYMYYSYNSYNSYYNYTYNNYDSYGLLNTTSLYNIKVPLTKGQLAAGSLMLASSVLFIIIFAITAYRVSKANQSQHYPSEPVTFIPPQNQYPLSQTNFPHNTTSGGNPVGQFSVTPPVNPLPPPPPYNAPVQIPINSTAPETYKIVCTNCRSRFHVAI